MRLATIRTDSGPRPGLVRDDAVVDISHELASVNDIVAAGAEGLRSVPDVDGPGIPLDEVTLGPPLTPRNIYCVGWNYLKHFEEGAAKRDEKLPDHPAFFSKASGTLIGPSDGIPAHEDVTSSL